MADFGGFEIEDDEKKPSSSSAFGGFEIEDDEGGPSGETGSVASASADAQPVPTWESGDGGAATMPDGQTNQWGGNLRTEGRKPLIRRGANGKVSGYSTTKSMLVQDRDGKIAVIPMVVDGKELSQEDAVRHYADTGEHWGKADDEDSARKMARAVHDEHQKAYQKGWNEYIQSHWDDMGDEIRHDPGVRGERARRKREARVKESGDKAAQMATKKYENVLLGQSIAGPVYGKRELENKTTQVAPELFLTGDVLEDADGNAIKPGDAIAVYHKEGDGPFTGEAGQAARLMEFTGVGDDGKPVFKETEGVSSEGAMVAGKLHVRDEDFDRMMGKGEGKVERSPFEQVRLGALAETGDRRRYTDDWLGTAKAVYDRLMPYAGRSAPNEQRERTRHLSNIYEGKLDGYDGKTEAEKYRDAARKAGLEPWNPLESLRPDENDAEFMGRIQHDAGEELRLDAIAKLDAGGKLSATEQSILDKIVKGGIESGGYALEFALPGGAMFKGAQALNWGAKAVRAATMLGSAVPVVATEAMSRYQENVTPEYGFDDNGEFKMVAAPDDEEEAAYKAIGGAIFDTAVEVGLESVTMGLLRGAGKATGWAFGKATPSAVREFGTKRFNKFMASETGQALRSINRAYQDFTAMTQINSPLGELAEENVQAFEKVIGLDGKSSEYKGLAQEWQDFKDNQLNWQTQWDIFYGLVAQLAIGAVKSTSEGVAQHISSADARRDIRMALKRSGISDETISTLTPEQQQKLTEMWQQYSADPDKLKEEVKNLGYSMRAAVDELTARDGLKMRQSLEQRGIAPERFTIQTGEDGKPVFQQMMRFTPDGKQAPMNAMTDAAHGVTIVDQGDGTFYVMNDFRGLDAVPAYSFEEAQKKADEEVVRNQSMDADNAQKAQYLTGLVQRQYAGRNVVSIPSEAALRWQVAQAINDGGNIYGITRADQLFKADGSLKQPGAGGFHTPDGHIVVILDNVPSPAEMERVLAHEATGHEGVESATGRGANTVEFIQNAQAEGFSKFVLAEQERAVQRFVAAGMDEDTARMQVAAAMSMDEYAREAMARYAQGRLHQPTWYEKRKHELNQRRRDAGENVPIDQSDLEVMLAEAEKQGAQGENELETLPGDSGVRYEEGVTDEARNGTDEAQPQPEQGEERGQEAPQPEAGAEPGAQAPDAGVVEPSKSDNGGQNLNTAERPAPADTIGGDAGRQPMSESSFWNVMHRKGERRRVPVDGIKIPDTQFKENADPKTGVVKGQELGEYYENAENPIAIYERKDGTMEIVTGRHRLDAAKRSGWKDIDARIFREADGYTPEDMRLYDAVANILDEKGTVKDYVRFFEESGFSEEDAKSSGILNRQKGRMAFGIVQNATDDTRGAIDWEGTGGDGLISAEQAAIIADAAPKQAALQRILVRRALDGVRGKKLAILARSLAEEAKNRKNAPKADSGTQLDLFTSEEDVALLQQEEKRADYRAKKANEYKRIAENLRTAMRKGGRLDLNKDYAKELGISDPKDKAQLAAARDKAVERANYWENAIRLDDADKAQMDADLGIAPQLSLESVTAEQITAEEKKRREKAEIKKRQEAPLKGSGAVNVQPEMDLGQTGQQDLFSPIAESEATAPAAKEKAAERPAEYLAWLEKYKMKDTDGRFAEWQRKQAARKPAKAALASAPRADGTTTPPKSADAPQVVKTTRDGESVRIVQNGREYEVELPDVKFPKTFTKATSKADWEAKMAEAKKIADELKKKAPFHSVINPKTGKYYANGSEIARQRQREVAAYEEAVRRATNQAFDEIGEYDDSWDEAPASAPQGGESAENAAPAAKPTATRPVSPVFTGEKPQKPAFKRGDRVFLKGAKDGQRVTFLKANADGTADVQVRTPGANRYAPEKVETRTVPMGDISATGMKDTLTGEERNAYRRGVAEQTREAMRSDPALQRIDAAYRAAKTDAERAELKAQFAERVRALQGGVDFDTPGIYTGTAADYANRSRQGGVDDGPSVKYIGTGEGSQVYGWGLYGSTERGVAEGYAHDDSLRKSGLAQDPGYDMPENGFPKWAIDSAREKLRKHGWNQTSRQKAIEEVSEAIDKHKSLAHDKFAEGLEVVKDILEKSTWHDAIIPKGYGTNNHLYEQTFFTNRAPGDESHLLKWYEPVEQELVNRIIDKAKEEGVIREDEYGRTDEDGKILLWADDGTGHYYQPVTLNGGYININVKTGEDLYKLTCQFFPRTSNRPKAASEFLARAGIDGVKYPVDSYGKTLKDGDKAGWNYVAFSDEHIRVDHKWTDGVLQFDTPELSADYSSVPERLDHSLWWISTHDEQMLNDIAALRKTAKRNIKAGADDTPSESEARDLKRRINEDNAKAREQKRLAEEDPLNVDYYKKRETYYREDAKELRDQLKELKRNGIGEDREEIDWYTNGDLLEILDSIESGEASISMHFDPYAIGPGEAGPFAEALKNLVESGNFKGEDLERLNRVAQKINDAYKAIERDIEDPRGPFGESLVSFDTPELTPAEAEYAASEDKTPTEKIMREVYGMTNDEIATALKAAGMEPPAHVRKTDADMWRQVETLLSNPTYMAKLSRAVAKFPRPTRDYENVALNVLFRQRQAAVNDLERRRAELAAIPEDDMNKTPELRDELRQVSAKLAQAKAQMAEAGKAAMMGASEQGRALRSNRALIAAHDYSYAGIAGRIAQTLGGIDKITPEMNARIRDLAKLFEGLDEEGLRLATERLIPLSKKVIDQTKNGLKVRKATERKVGDVARKVAQNYQDALTQIEVGAAETGGTLIGLSDQQYPSWGKWLRQIGEYHCFLNPEITEEEVIDAIVRDISPFMDGVDANQVRDALTGFGHNYKQSRYDAQRLMNSLRNISRSKRQIDWMDETNTMPPATGPIRDEPTQDEREWAKRVRDRKAEVPDAGRDERRLKSTLDTIKRNLENRIADLKRAIETGERIPVPKRKVVDDIRVRELRAEKDELQKQYDELFGTTREMTDAQRIALTEKLLAKELERAMEDFARAQSGDFSKRPQRPGVTSETIETLRDRIRQVRESIRELKNAKYAFGMTPEEIEALNARKMASREKALARLAERIATGDIRPQKKPQPPMTKDQQKRYDELGEQMKRGRQKLAELRLEAENATVPTFVRKGVNFLRFVTTAQRALRATMDFSAVLRQAARMTLGHPVKAARSFGKAWTAARSEASLLDVNTEILSDPTVQEAVKKFGLHLREVDAQSDRDVEMFHGMERNKVKIFGKEYAITDIPLFGEFMLKSERHYLTYLNAMSADLYTSIVNGIPGGATPWQKKMIADMINIWNGSAALSKERRQALQKAWVNDIFWAPQLAISRVQSAVGYDIWHPLVAKGIKNADGSFDKVSNDERKTAAKIGLREHLRSTVAMLAIGSLLKWLFSDDDDKYDFSQADWFEKMMMIASPKIGNTTIDLTGGESTFNRLVHQLATKSKRSSTGRVMKFGDFNGPTTMGAIGRYLQGKLSPSASTIVALWEGKDYVGEEYGVGNMVWEMLVPLTFDDVKDQIVQNGVGKSLVTVPLSILGAGGSTYDRKPYDNAVNRFLEEKRAYDAISKDAELTQSERKELLDGMKSESPLMADSVRGDIDARIKAVNRLERKAKDIEKKGGTPTASLTNEIERQKSILLDKIRRSRRK